MQWKRARVWSPADLEYLAANKDKPHQQLAIQLMQSLGAIKRKLDELDGKKVAEKPIARGRLGNKIGKRADCNNTALRSGWEADCYRVFMRDKSITLLEYEPQDFGFWEFGVHKGQMGYTPDFRLTYKDGHQEFVEVKGNFLKSADRVKLRRFKKFYPQEFAKLVAITPSSGSKTTKFFESLNVPIKYYFNELNKKYRGVIPFWES